MAHSGTNGVKRMAYSTCSSIEEARNARPGHFDLAFNHAVKNRMSVPLALVMARGFSSRGYVDASCGYVHYALRIMIARIS